MKIMGIIEDILGCMREKYELDFNLKESGSKYVLIAKTSENSSLPITELYNKRKVHIKLNRYKEHDGNFQSILSKAKNKNHTEFQKAKKYYRSKMGINHSF